MRIAINTRFLLKDKLEGIGWFTYEVVKRIVLSHPEHEFVFLFDRAYDESFIFAKNVKPVVVNPPARHPVLWYLWFEWAIPSVLKKEKIDLFLSTDGYLSLKTKVPTAVVLHDLAFVHHPEDVHGLVSKYYNYFTPLFAKRANRILTVSEFTKQDVIKNYKIDSDLIDVVYNGVNDSFKPLPVDEKAKVKDTLTKGEDYFVYIGALHPRKNINRLFKAFDAFKKQTNSTTKLVIVGRKAWSVKEIEETYESMTFKADVIFTGRLSTSDLIETLASSKALTYIPYFEGFGIPIIEAQKCGVPVITSNRTSMPEVAGDSAHLVDPFDEHSIQEALVKLDAEEEYRKLLIEKGSENVQRFSWDITAQLVWNGMMKTI